jgi:hypothetical protein
VGIIIDFGQFPLKSLPHIGGKVKKGLNKKLFVLGFEAAQGLWGEIEVGC